MPKIKVLLLTMALMLFFAPASSRSQQKGRRPGPINRGVVPPKPREVAPAKPLYKWEPIFTGSVSTLYTGTSSELFALTESSLYRSQDFGVHWTLLFTPPTETLIQGGTLGYKWHLIFQQSSAEPQVMYIALVGHANNFTTDFYAGSLWKSMDGGKNWQHLNDNKYVSGSMPFDPRYKTGQGSVVSNLVVSPKNPNLVFMTGVEGRLYKSLNGGSLWTDITPPDTRPWRITINPHNVENMYLLDGQHNPLETTDSGSTWHELNYDLSLLETGFNEFYDKRRQWTWIAFHPDMPTRLFGVVNSHLVVSDDGGRSWKDISFTTGTFKYITNSRSDGERTGHKIASVDVLRFSHTATEALYISANDGLYKSSDLGQTWTLLFQQPTLGFAVSNDEKKILALTPLGVFLSSEGFGKWSNAGHALPPAATTDLTAIDSFGSPLYLRKSNGDLIKSDNTTEWEWETNPFKGIQCQWNYDKADYKVIQFFKTQDGTSYTVADCMGMGYRKVTRETPDKVKEEIRTTDLGYDQWCKCRIALSPLDSQRVYLYSDRKLLVSSDGGKNWSESIKSGVSVAVVSPKNPNIAYAVLTSNNNSLNSVISTTDGGKTWRAGTTSLQDLAITQGLSDQFWSVTAAPEDSNIAYVTSKNAVFRTSDSGQTWTLVTRNRFSGEIYDIAFEHGSKETIYLATSNGVWRSKDSGINWEPFSESVPIYSIRSTNDFTIAFGKGVIYRLGR